MLLRPSITSSISAGCWRLLLLRGVGETDRVRALFLSCIKATSSRSPKTLLDIIGADVAVVYEGQGLGSVGVGGALEMMGAEGVSLTLLLQSPRLGVEISSLGMSTLWRRDAR